MKIVINGIVKNTSNWVLINQSEADSSATLEQVNEGADEIRNLIGQAFKSGQNGHLTFGTDVINIQAFAVISVDVKE